MKVINTIRVYEEDDEEIKIGTEKELQIVSHWNYKDFVVLEFEGKSITVNAEDLKKAIENATNH